MLSISFENQTTTKETTTTNKQNKYDTKITNYKNIQICIHARLNLKKKNSFVFINLH